jgi:hypothetical protein
MCVYGVRVSERERDREKEKRENVLSLGNIEDMIDERKGPAIPLELDRRYETVEEIERHWEFSLIQGFQQIPRHIEHFRSRCSYRERLIHACLLGVRESECGSVSGSVNKWSVKERNRHAYSIS